MEPGYVAPDGQVLTDSYLACEIAGRPVVSNFIYHGDIYSAVPDVLVSGRQHVRDSDDNDAYFFYTTVRYADKKKTRKLRRIDGDPRKSCWHSEKGKIPLEGSEVGGYVQDFVHAIKGTDGRIERLGWRMKEYGLSTEEHGDSDLVLCKVYRTPRGREPTTTASTSATSATPSTPVPVSDDPNVSKKRKAADGDHHEDSMPCERPRLTDDHPLMADPTLTPENDAQDQLFKTYSQVMDHERIKETRPIVADAVQEIDASWRQDQATQPEPESIEQEFQFLYPNHNNDAVAEEAVPPWPPAAQPEEGDATGLVETITAEDQMDAILGEEGAQPEPEWDMEQEFPFLYPSPSHDNDVVTEEAAPPCSPAAQPEEDPATGLVETITTDNQIDAISLEEEGVHTEPEPEPEEPAPDEVIYGLPCPAFSPEMIWRCSDDVLTPWPSPSSMRMIFDLY
ncbi:hypothetical protein ACQ4PT_032932 [Festuca glaucescens]